MTSLAELPDAFDYHQALTEGISRARLRRAVRDGEVCRPSRGRYEKVGPTLEPAERWELTRQDHIRLLRDTLERHPGCAASHDSAAIVHDLPLVVSPKAEIQLVRIEDFPSSRCLPGVRIHHADSMETSTEVVDGIRTTTVPRTVADCLRTRRLPHGLALLDQSLRDDRVALADVEKVVAQQVRWVGRPKAREVIELADPRRESYGESHSFGLLHVGGYPMPIPQVEIYDELFRFVARVDGLLDHERVVSEVHGEVKYFLDPVSDDQEESVAQKLVQEQDRKKQIERLGLVVADWTVDTAMHRPDEVHHTLNRAIARASATTFTGWVRWEGQFCKLPLLPRT